MTFRGNVAERVEWVLRMDEEDRDILVEWLQYALTHFEDVVCDSEAEDIIALMAELGHRA